MLAGSFARAVGLFDNFFNKVVARFTGGEFCHSEFVVTWDEKTAAEFFDSLEGHEKLQRNYTRYLDDGELHICFYLLWGDTASYRMLKKDHNNPFYRYPDGRQFQLVELNTTKEEEFKVARFLLEQYKKHYDYAGALSYWFPLRASQMEYPTYFCSQQMLCALQHIGRFRDTNPSSVTPNKLFDLMSTCK